MESTRSTFLAGASVAMLALFPEISEAAVNDQAAILTLYAAPKDPVAFDSHYFSVHEQLVKQLPGITSYRVSKGAISALGMKQSPYHLISIVGFSSMASLQAAFTSAIGQKLSKDMGTFAEAGMSVMILSLSEQS